MARTDQTFFAPELCIPNGTMDVDFYIRAFGAKELRRFSNDDGSIHVSEMEINGALFHLHEITANAERFSPAEHKGTTVIVGLFVPDVDAVIESALAAGAILVNPAQSYDYGYRQGDVQDPHGHVWMIEQKI
jgi:PhnB protein